MVAPNTEFAKVLDTFAAAIDALKRLPPDDQVEVVEIVRQRIAEQSRDRIAQEIEASRRDYEEGRYRVMTADEFMKEIAD